MKPRDFIQKMTFILNVFGVLFVVLLNVLNSFIDSPINIVYYGDKYLSYLLGG